MPRFTRSAIIRGSLLLFAAALTVRAAHVQLVQGRSWAERARRQQFAGADIPAPRGTIYDVSRVPLAESREVVAVSIAPREVRPRDLPRLARELAKLKVPRTIARRATDTSQRWVTIPGSFLPGDVATLAAMRGVHPSAVLQRSYTRRQSTRRIVGAVDQTGAAVSGLEAALDEHLKGTAGRAVVVRDARGRRSASPAAEGVDPEPGDDVVLTINQELQEISERALADAVAKLGAEGGDIVVLDPHSGEIRALATLRADHRSSGSPALSEPFEPGSTLKPFVAARLLALGRTRPDEVVNTENGLWVHDGRAIHDVHKAPQLTVADVIAQSSNIGISKLAMRLSHREQFELLRDFGFGTPTGVPYPSEASGLLRAPANWSKTSSASLAMGYEISVTALQLALAYATFANGGELLEPALVREIRTRDGGVKYRHQRRVVRRVMSEEIAATMRQLLRGTVAGGSASEADLGTFQVAGKTGTARKNVRGRYVSGQYTASFVGLFPADRPQYVILVKLDNPTAAIYGGKTAAPVTRAVIEAAVAAKDAALDRTLLAGSAVRRPPDSAGAGTTVAASAESAESAAAPAAPVAVARPPEPPPATPYVLDLPLAARRDSARRAEREVPEVRGLPVRQAARVLHRAGFQVKLVGSGSAVATWPSAGARAPAGSVVRLTAQP